MELTSGPGCITRLVARVAIRVGGIADMTAHHAVRWRIRAATGTKVARTAITRARSLRSVIPLRSRIPSGGLHSVASKAVGTKFCVQEGRVYNHAIGSTGVAPRFFATRRNAGVIDASACPGNAW